ncbi:MAG: ATP-binding cassette domain-containing protein [Candidatus Caldarchaeum sp.]
MGEVILSLRTVEKKFGGVEALRGVEMDVMRGELFGLIGPNGAGKTVLMNVVSGIYPPDNGRVFLKNRDVTGYTSHLIARLGVARTFQIPKIFPDMSLLENVLIPVYALNRELRGEEGKRQAFKALEFVGLHESSNLKAKNLSGGQKKLLEFARGIAMKAELYLMDEPFAGVNPIIINRMLGAVREVVKNGSTAVVVSHELGIVSRLCNRVAVLDRGLKIAEGPLREIAFLAEVKRAYLGG